MENPKKPKLLSMYLTKPKTVDGDGCRIRFAIYDNGVIVIERRMFVEEGRKDWEVLRPFMGKNYCKQSMGFKYGTFARIFQTATNDLMSAGIKKEDIA